MDFVLPPPATPSVAIAGSSRRFPLRRIFCVGRNYAAHAREMGKDPASCPPWIDYVGGLEQVGRSFGAVVSSQAIVHNPDLIHHLGQVERILDPALRHILVERFVERMRGDAHRIVLDGEQRLRLQPARHQIGTGGGQHGGGQQNGSDIRTVH